jgi:signal recognition particle GTPase
LDNLGDVLGFIQQAKDKEEKYRKGKVKAEYRQKTLMTFIDFKKAFDRIDREILCRKMLKFGYSKTMIGAI